MMLARRCLEARGYMVDTAVAAVRMIPNRRKPGTFMPLTYKHDFFNVWDAIVVRRWIDEDGAMTSDRFFVQVTDATNVGHRRAKILASKFPCTPDDLLLGYRGRSVFRVLRGPDFTEGEEWTVPKATKGGAA